MFKVQSFKFNGSFLTTEAQRYRGLSTCCLLYGEPAKTLRRFCLRRRSQRKPLSSSPRGGEGLASERGESQEFKEFK